MAIPFAVPSDEQSEAALGQLLLDLIDINQQIQILLRSRAQNQIAPVSPRVCTPRRTRNHSREVYDQERMPELVNNLSFISTNLNARTDLDIVVLPAAAAQSLSASARRSRRQRTSSESSCCEETKYGTTIADIEEDTDLRDWTQVGVILRKIADDQRGAFKEEDTESSRCKGGCRHECNSRNSNSSLLSKLVPAPIKSSLWTAVICIVGWHLFRAR